MESSNELQQAVPGFSFESAFKYTKQEIKAFLREITVESPLTKHSSETKKDLRVLWEHYLEPLFSSDVVLPLDKKGKPTIRNVTIYNSSIEIYSAYCALSAVLTLALPRPNPKVVTGLKYSFCMVVLLAKWSLEIAPPDPLSEDDPPATLFPATVCVMHADEFQQKAVAQMDDMLFVCGTTKVGPDNLKKKWAQNREGQLMKDLGLHPLSALKDHPEAKKFRKVAPSSREVIEEIKVAIKETWPEEISERLNKTLDNYAELVGLIPGEPRQQLRQGFGDCAETWGIGIMVQSLERGSSVSSISISLEEVSKVKSLSDDCNIHPAPLYKLACDNCMYLFAVADINCEIIISDAAPK